MLVFPSLFPFPNIWFSVFFRAILSAYRTVHCRFAIFDLFDRLYMFALMSQRPIATCGDGLSRPNLVYSIIMFACHSSFRFVFMFSPSNTFSSHSDISSSLSFHFNETSVFATFRLSYSTLVLFHMQFLFTLICLDVAFPNQPACKLTASDRKTTHMDTLWSFDSTSFCKFGRASINRIGTCKSN